jgi:ribonucleotide reductase alpha subunit
LEGDRSGIAGQPVCPSNVFEMQRFSHDLEAVEASKELTDARNAAKEAWRDYRRKEKEENLRRKELEKVEREERKENNRVHANLELQVIDSSFLKIELNFPLIDLIGSCCRLSGGRWPILMWEQPMSPRNF